MKKINLADYIIEDNKFDILIKEYRNIADSLENDFEKIKFYEEQSKDVKFIQRKFYEFFDYLKEYEGYCDNLKIFLDSMVVESKEFCCLELTNYISVHSYNWLKRLKGKPFADKEVETNSPTVEFYSLRFERNAKLLDKVIEFVENELIYLKKLFSMSNKGVQTNFDSIGVQWRGNDTELYCFVNELTKKGFLTDIDKENFLKLIKKHFIDKKGKPFSEKVISQGVNNLLINKDKKSRNSFKIDEIISSKKHKQE